MGRLVIAQGFMIERRLDYEAAFDFAAEHEFDFVELNMDYAFERQRVDASAVNRAAASRGLDLVTHLPYRLDPGSPHEHVRDGACRELEAALDTAATLGASKAVFHGTSLAHPEKWANETIREYIYESVARVDAAAREHGIDACVENLKTPFFDAGDFSELFARTDANACLDTGHAHVTGQTLADQAELLREYGDRVSHVHLNDTRRDDTDEHLPVGLGALEFAPLADAMHDTGWSGTCTHELTATGYEYATRGRATFNDLRAG